MNIQYHCNQLHKSVGYEIEPHERYQSQLFYNCKETVNFDIEQEWKQINETQQLSDQ